MTIALNAMLIFHPIVHIIRRYIKKKYLKLVVVLVGIVFLMRTENDWNKGNTMLTKYDDCPLNKDLAPTCPNCKKCDFYTHTFTEECKIYVARDSISSIIGNSPINSHVDNIAFDIIEMLIKNKLIKEVIDKS